MNSYSLMVCAATMSLSTASRAGASEQTWIPAKPGTIQCSESTDMIPTKEVVLYWILKQGTADAESVSNFFRIDPWTAVEIIDELLIDGVLERRDV